MLLPTDKPEEHVPTVTEKCRMQKGWM